MVFFVLVVMDGSYEDYNNYSEDLYDSDGGQDEAWRDARRYAGIVIGTSGSSDEDEPRAEPPRSQRMPLKSLSAKSFYRRGKSSTSSCSSSSVSRRHKRMDKENQVTPWWSVPSSSGKSSNCSSDEVTKSSAVKQLEHTNKLLGELLERMKSTEDCLKGLEDKYLSSTLSSSSSNGSTPKRSSRKKEVPREVRVS